MSSTCSNISMYSHNVPYAKKILSFFIYIHTSLGRSAGTVEWNIPKTEEHFHTTQALLVLFYKLLIICS